jgi:hypothetical protein
MSRFAPIVSLVPALGLSVFAAIGTAHAGPPVQPSLDKKTRHIQVTAEMPHSAAEVWGVLAEDYGRVADSHPRIVKSDYLRGSLKGELGAERSCWFNEKGSQVLNEQIVGWDPAEMTFQNRIVSREGFPIDPDNTLATYSVVAIDGGHSRVTIEMDFRTAPAMMGGMMKGSFENLLGDYLTAVDHHLRTGESVNRDNFAMVKSLYK